MAKRLSEKDLEQMNAHLAKSPKKCGKSRVCGMLSLAFNMSDSRRGIVAQLICNLKTGKSHRSVTYFGGDFVSGIRLNFCPFCGKKTPELKD